MAIIRNCAWCGEQFKARKSGQLMCCDECRIAMRKSKSGAKERTEAQLRRKHAFVPAFCPWDEGMLGINSTARGADPVLGF